ncbi:MAG: hypothetical protein JNG88_01650 [Phycisphaerales bacterium]|nr:hypothetical protein [Phycisphaerales bacterium]
MTESSFARSRKAAVLGLLLQIATFVALFLLANFTHSGAAAHLAWLAAGGAPILLAIVLVFRQHELAALEKLDLEELRREKAATGGGDAMFDTEGGGGIGFMVAASRLQWMQRWLVPFFGLASGLYLIGAGLWWWRKLGGRAIGSPDWPEVSNLPMAMLVLSVIMLLQFLFSRFATGLARVPHWQMMRAAGSFMFLQSIAAFALIIALGVQLYSESRGAWEHALAYVYLILMMLVGAETLINMVLDIYRPRTPGSEPRAAFDSRVLGLVAEPTDIAASIAETLNYQFGFKVSQTWFYQLMQRWFIPLVGFGLLIIWLLSSLVIVAPFEQAIVERFGKQINADDPLGPGIHVIRPWPFEIARKFNTRQLQHLTLGYKSNVVNEEEEARAHSKILLWTDTKHGGLEEFPFIVIAPTEAQRGATTQPAAESDRGVPYHSVRMTVKVQYEIVRDKLARFTQAVDSPHVLLRNLAWRELTRFNASSDIDSLLGAKRTQAGDIIRGRINQRLKEMDIGLAVVYVGLQDVHPAKTVADAFRNVIAAEQEKVTAVRRAIVVENETLSKVAGEKSKALRLAAAINGDRESERRLSEAELRLRAANTPLPADFESRMKALAPHFQAQLEARWAREQAENKLAQTQEDYDLGLGGSSAAVAAATKSLEECVTREKAATAALDAALQPMRQSMGGASLDYLNARVDQQAAQVASNFWQRNIEAELPGLLGDAAVAVATAQAKRWERELQAQTELETQVSQNEAYRAAPEVFKAREYLQTLADGIRNSRKFLFTFDSSKYPQVRLRIDANETASPDQMSVREPDVR